MAFSAKDVAALRERTSCGMMDCKKALADADGDMERAVEILREKGLAASAKKAGRIAAEGTVYAYVDAEKQVGVVIEVNAETDFVAKNDSFMAFVDTAAKTVIESDPADVDALLECKAVGSDMTVADLLRDKILTIGENIKVRRFQKYDGAVVSYVHAGGKIGVLVRFDADPALLANDAFVSFGKDIAMQIAAVSPQYLTSADVPEEVIEKEKAIRVEQLKNDPKNANKPTEILEKIVTGKMGKFYEEICLLQQAFVKDGSMSVAQYVESVSKAIGAPIAIAEFVRFEKGEGLQKREDDFAAEVAAMSGN